MVLLSRLSLNSGLSQIHHLSTFVLRLQDFCCAANAIAHSDANPLHIKDVAKMRRQLIESRKLDACRLNCCRMLSEDVHCIRKQLALP